MKSIFLAILGGCALLASAKHSTAAVKDSKAGTVKGSIIPEFGCGTNHSKASAHFNATVKKLHQDHKHSKAGARAAQLHTRQTVATPWTVDTYFHVVTTAASANAYPASMISAQLATMNTVYNSMGITFNLINTSYTSNDAWASCSVDDDNMLAAQQALHVGSYSDLNIWFFSDFAAGALGTCSLPTSVPPGTPSNEYYNDGCAINANTMPGGSQSGYNLGMTAVHETGHWLGLLHTFEGNACTGDGDYVSDTPPESVSTSGCPSGKASCPSQSSADPIHNYMDYSTDACYEQFTPGQVSRISSLWTEYRASFAP